MAKSKFTLDPEDPADAMRQVSIRVPHWYYERLQKQAPSATVPNIVLDILDRSIPLDKKARFPVRRKTAGKGAQVAAELSRLTKAVNK